VILKDLRLSNLNSPPPELAIGELVREVLRCWPAKPFSSQTAYDGTLTVRTILLPIGAGLVGGPTNGGELPMRLPGQFQVTVGGSQRRPASAA